MVTSVALELATIITVVAILVRGDAMAMAMALGDHMFELNRMASSAADAIS